jgi:hypothetical protein
MVQRSQVIPKLDESSTASGFVLKAVVVVTMTATLLTVAVLAAVTMRRTDAHPLEIGIPDRLLPGNPLPSSARCDWYTVNEHMLYCTVTENGLSAYLSFDIDHQMIRSATLAVQDKVVGDLILAWGEPTGFAKSGLSNQVYWGNRSVYLLSTPFRPDTRVGYVFYSLSPYTAGPWRGFVNR